MIQTTTELFTFQLATRFRYGEGAAGFAGEELSGLGVRRVLVVTDPGVLAADVCASALGSLRDAGIDYELFSELVTNPSDVQVDAAREAFTAGGADGILGVGGGSALDVAKSAALVTSNGGDIREYEDGARPVVRPHPPLVLVPTTSGTGSEAVGGAIITDSNRQFKMHIVAVPAHVALCDPLLTLSLPPAVTAATGLDALSHAVGAYASVERQPLADAMALFAIGEIDEWLLQAVANGDDRTARARMMVASTAAGISTKGGGTADHAFSHALNAMFNVHHGVGCAIFLADVMEHNLAQCGDRYARVATTMGIRASPENGSYDGAHAAIHKVRELVNAAGIPSLADLGVTPDDVPALADKVMEDEFHLGLNPVPVTVSDARSILVRAVERAEAA